MENPVAPDERRQPREEIEVDGKAVSVLGPALDAEHRHGTELHDGVRDAQPGQGLRGLLRVHELEPREAEDRRDRGPAPEPLRIWAPDRRADARTPARPCDRSADGQPRVERPEDVSD